MNYSKLQQRNGLVDLPQPTVQMSFVESMPVIPIEVGFWADIRAELKLDDSMFDFLNNLTFLEHNNGCFYFEIQNTDCYQEGDMTKLMFALRKHFNDATIEVRVFGIGGASKPVDFDEVNFDDLPPIDDEPDFTIPPENAIVTNPKVMLSIEIAALTGKNHKDVMRDIRVIVEQMQSADLRFACESTSYKGSNGQEYKCYELDYEATMIVMTGYDVVARAKVIKRWQELETLAKLYEVPKVRDVQLLKFNQGTEI